MGVRFTDVILEEDAPVLSVWPSETVTKFLLEEITETDDGFVSHVLWTQEQVESNQVLNLHAYLGEVVPRFRIKCVNKNGETECWYIEESGKDGSILLTDGFQPSPEPAGLEETLLRNAKIAAAFNEDLT